MFVGDPLLVESVQVDPDILQVPLMPVDLDILNEAKVGLCTTGGVLGRLGAPRKVCSPPLALPTACIGTIV